MSRLSRCHAIAGAAIAALVLGAHALFGAGSVFAQQDQPGAELLSVDLDAMTPRMIDGEAETLTVSGEVTNVGDRVVAEPSLRLQRGAPLRSDEQAEQALAGEAPTSEEQSPFETIAGELQPGEAASFTLRVPVADPDGLGVTETGVYPLLLNVNGQPELGEPARLGAISMLLPVLEPPESDQPGEAQPGEAQPGEGQPGEGQPGEAQPGETQPDEAQGPGQIPGAEQQLGQGAAGQAGPPVPVSLLWPIASTPRVVTNPVGDELVLTDDGLAESMRPGGRLHDLVDTADELTGQSTDEDDEDSGEEDGDDPGSIGEGDLAGAVCFAIDPEVVLTAEAMTEGYEVRDAPSPDAAAGGAASTVSGTGAEDAGRWLDSLAELLEDACVITTAYAGSDVAALASAAPELAEEAVRGEDAVAEILDIDLAGDPDTDADNGQESSSGLFWPRGPLTADLLDVLDDAGKDTLIAEPATLRAPAVFDRPARIQTEDGEQTGQRAVPADELIAQGFAAEESAEELPYRLQLPASVPEIATQNGLAALAQRALTRQDTAPLVLAPPRTWQPDADELRHLAGGLMRLAEEDLIAPSPLEVTTEAETEGTALPAPDQRSLATHLPAGVVETVRGAGATLADLEQAMAVDAPTQVEPAEALRPARQALLRVTGEDLRGDAPAAEAAAEGAREQLTELLELVRVEHPGRSIQMASGTSPLPVVVTNDLPVEVTVQLNLSNTLGLRIDEVPTVTVPAGASITQQVPAEAVRSGRFSVDVALATPEGTSLGEPVRMELASTQYGWFTVIVTATAAAALLLLSGRRIYQRVAEARASGAASAGRI